MKRTLLASLISLSLCMGNTTDAHAGSGEYNLSDYGPVATPAAAEATFEKAVTNILAKSGGVLVVGPEVNKDWVAENNAPSSTQRGSPAVTILDRRFGYEEITVPANGKHATSVWAGRRIRRVVREPIDMPQGMHSTESVDTYIAGGTASYNQPSLEDAKAGENQRVYVPTIRGIFVGIRLIITGAPMNYAEPFDRVVVKGLGWDKEKQRNYFVADLQHDHPKSALVYDKHVVNSMTVTDHSNSDNQSMGLAVARYNYGQGDSFVVSANMRSQGNIMSAAGDEGGLCYAADIYNDLRPFRSTVESVNWEKQELVYAPGAVRNHTLGTSRPIINMNTNKHVISGAVFIVAPGHRDPWDPQNKEETGKTFERKVLVSGAIIGSKDCGWTQDIVGRFFAVDEPTEYLDPKNDPGAGYSAAPDIRVYRWYLIQKLEDRPDGAKRLYVERTFWFSGNHLAPNLYRSDNCTGEGHERPLKYIIAPGAYAADVSQAWTDSEASGGSIGAGATRTLKLAPNGDVNTKFDFAKGDPIVQAIGQDPWNPTGVRVRHHNYLPSAMPDASFHSVNYGRVAVAAGLAIHGDGGDLAKVEKRKDGQPGFLKGVEIHATTGVGISFAGDVRDAALHFEQPHGRAQPIRWNFEKGHSTLSVDVKDGTFRFGGGDVYLCRKGVRAVTGLSGSETAAQNLRGINVPVPKGAMEISVKFEKPEADGQYSLNVQPNWITQDAVTEKTAQGFKVVFATPALDQARVDWQLIR